MYKFFISTANHDGADWPLLDALMPVGISFFTPAEMAFLVDVHRRVVVEYNFINYL